MSSTTERYDIQTRLAVGCAGLVYHAVDRLTGFPVALKLLMASDEFTHPFDVEALLRDRSRLRKISGPHVAQLLDAFEDSDGPVLVYQFIDGESGAALPAARRVEKNEAIDLAAQFLAALECAEKTKLPHGDWKPSNVVIGKTDAGRAYVLVLDWGLAAFRAEPTPDSLLFLSPERLLGEAASFRADIFSAGAVLHYLLSGRALVGGPDRASVAAAWRQVKPENLKEQRPDLPAKFVDWLAWLMDVRPKKRPATVAEARRALAAFDPPPPPTAPKHLSWRPDSSAFESSSGIRRPPAKRASSPQFMPRPLPARRATSVLIPRIADARPPVAVSSAEIPERVPVPALTEAATTECAEIPSGKKRWHPIVFTVLALLAGILLAQGIWIIRRHHARIAAVDTANQPAAEGKNPPTVHPALEAVPGPAAWADYDVGNPARPGDSAFDSKTGVWSIRGGGADIWLSSDQFHFTGERLSGNAGIVARVTGFRNANSWAKSGVMFRNSSAHDAAFAQMVVSAAGDLAFEWRPANGARAESVKLKGPLPLWVKVERAANQFSGHYSKDGSKWQQLGRTETVEMPIALLAGLCVNAHSPDALSTSTFTNVSITPPGWGSDDVGGPRPGGAIYDSFAKRWTVRGGGLDIWFKSDQFHFVSQDVSGDKTLEVQVISLEPTDPWAKAGLMFRAGSSPNAANVALVSTAGMGTSFQWRASAGVDCLTREHPGIVAPVKLKLERKGNTFTASVSKEGKAWTQIETQAIKLPQKLEAGYCLTAHNPAAITTAVFAQ